MAAIPAAAAMAASHMARAAVRAAAATAAASGTRLADSVPREIVDDIFAHALKKQTGVSLKYMVGPLAQEAAGRAGAKPPAVWGLLGAGL